MPREFYKCKHFTIKELVDKETFNKFGESAWMFFNPEDLKVIDALREDTGRAMYINNWASGGQNDSRGLRRPTDPTGATFSPHRFTKAFDISFEGWTAEQARQHIFDNQDHYPYNQISRIELAVNWVHIDFFNVDSPEIVKFNG